MPNNGVMASLPRPLLALLVATVASFAVWTVALKPGSSPGGSANSPTAPIFQSAIAKAHKAVAQSAQANAADGAPVSSGAAPVTHAKSAPATTLHHVAKAATTHPSVATTSAKPNSGPPVSQKSVLAAISAHRVVALLFYNPAAPDDTAVRHELAGISGDRGQVAKFTVPVTQLSHFGALTAKVPVNATPTLIVIDKQGQATSLVGFTDRFEIAQRISDAVRAK
jgi:hypothetical protein